MTQLTKYQEGSRFSANEATAAEAISQDWKEHGDDVRRDVASTIIHWHVSKAWTIMESRYFRDKKKSRPSQEKC
jgi:hypothetical protein